VRKTKQDKDEDGMQLLIWEVGFMQWGVSIDDKWCCCNILLAAGPVLCEARTPLMSSWRHLKVLVLKQMHNKLPHTL